MTLKFKLRFTIRSNVACELMILRQQIRGQIEICGGNCCVVHCVIRWFRQVPNYGPWPVNNFQPPRLVLYSMLWMFDGSKYGSSARISPLI